MTVSKKPLRFSWTMMTSGCESEREQSETPKKGVAAVGDAIDADAIARSSPDADAPRARQPRCACRAQECIAVASKCSASDPCWKESRRGESTRRGKRQKMCVSKSNTSRFRAFFFFFPFFGFSYFVTS